MDFNKNNKQYNFNQVRGVLNEIKEGENFCNITLVLGQDNSRFANFVLKTKSYNDYIKDKYKIGDRFTVRFYLCSKKKHDRWYTTAQFLDAFTEEIPNQ